MPCLNEKQTLPICIRRAKDFLKKHQIRGEIIVGDNGSTDGSAEVARRLGAKVVTVPERGYGAALIAACKAARGKYIIMGDSDDSYHFDECAPFLEELRKGADLVMGNRFAGGIMPGAMPWKNRYIGNPLLSFVGRLLFGTQVRDFHCGLRAFSLAAFARMGLRTTGMEFASEMVIKASLLKMRIAEVPVVLYKDGRDRPPHLRPWRDGWRHLRFMLLYSPRWLFLYPGIFLMFISIIAGIFIFPGTRSVWGITPQLHTLLFCSAGTIMGFQAILYSYLAKSFAVREKLLNPDKLIRFFDRIFSLEIGIVCGLVLLLLGFAIAAYGLYVWYNHNFGSLKDILPLQWSVAAITLMILGIELILFSFFASVLELKVKE